MTALSCPVCQTPVLVGDRFCEECGTALIANSPSHSSKSSQPTACVKCGATAIDAEGYCAQCGFRNPREKGSNGRIEVVRSPRLVGISDAGVRYAHNEDFVAIQELDESVVLVVCDGVSSSASPDQASKMVAETMIHQLEEPITYASSEAAIRMAIQSALRSVGQLPVSPDLDPPSTTMVSAIVQGKTATIAWIGDSRAYWIADTHSRQLTQDHSWFNEVVTAGDMSEIEAKASPYAHAITRWIGGDVQYEAEPDVVQIDIPGPGYLILCSDGLWNYTPEAEHLLALVRPIEQPDALSVATQLVEYARSRGGHDNITVAVLQIGRSDDSIIPQDPGVSKSRRIELATTPTRPPFLS